MKKQTSARLLLAAFLSILAAFLVVACGHREGGTNAQEGGTNVKLEAGNAGLALETSNTLVTAFPILNEGKGAADTVRAESVSLQGASRTSPAALPVALGSIKPDGEAVVYATFSSSSFTPGNTYPMRVEGTYTENGQEHKFAVEHAMRIPPASPGSAVSGGSSSPANKVSGGKYPHQPPNFSKEVNEGHAWKVPTGTFRQPAPPPQEMQAQPAPKGDPPKIDFFTNASLGTSSSTTNEPSGGVGGGVVFTTANWFAAYSITGGSSFTQLDPTTIFPNNADGGFCCDQIVQYVASIDRIVWVMQFNQVADAQGNLRNRYRLAAASPADVKNSNGTAWTYWDFTTAQLGINNGWLDYPDVAVGTNSLYLSYDQVGVGRAVIRIPLAEIQSGSTINFQFTDPTKSPMAYGGHLSQSTRDEVFWAGPNTNSSMRVFSWQESSNTYSWRDVAIASWPNATLSSLTPDNQDWLTKLQNFPGNAVLGATRAFGGKATAGPVNQIWFAWTASSGSGFKQAQVQWVALDRSHNFNVVAQSQIWNGSYAFAYPALGVNSDGEIGLSLEYGGGGNYENHVVGFWGDYIAYITTASNVGITRYGDYVTIRPDAAQPRRFDAWGYGLNQPSPGVVNSDTHYVMFGRP